MCLRHCRGTTSNCNFVPGVLDVPRVFMILGQICAIAEVHEVKFVFTVLYPLFSHPLRSLCPPFTTPSPIPVCLLVSKRLCWRSLCPKTKHQVTLTSWFVYWMSTCSKRAVCISSLFQYIISLFTSRRRMRNRRRWVLNTQWTLFYVNQSYYSSRHSGYNINVVICMI